MYLLNIRYIYWAVNIVQKRRELYFWLPNLSYHREHYYLKYIFHWKLCNKACVTITMDLGNLPRIIFIKIHRKRTTEDITFWLEIDLRFIFVWLTLHMKSKTKDQKDAWGEFFYDSRKALVCCIRTHISSSIFLQLSTYMQMSNLSGQGRFHEA